MLETYFVSVGSSATGRNQRKEKEMDNENKIEIKKSKTLIVNDSEKLSNCDKFKQSASLKAFDKSDNVKIFSNNSNRYNDIKKKLYFSTGNEDPNATIVEETKACLYKKVRLRSNSEQRYRIKEENFLRQIEKEEEKKEKKIIIKPNGDFVYDLNISNVNQSKNFKNVNSINVSIAIMNSELQKLSVAEKYDIEHNFFPKPSCSNVYQNIQSESVSSSDFGTTNDESIKFSQSDHKKWNSSWSSNCDTLNVLQKQLLNDEISNNSNNTAMDTRLTIVHDIDNEIDEYDPNKLSLTQNCDFSSQVEQYQIINKRKTSKITLDEIDLFPKYSSYSPDSFEDSINDTFNVKQGTDYNIDKYLVNNDSININDTLVTSFKLDELLPNKSLISNNSQIFIPKFKIPKFSEINDALSKYNIPENQFELPFYSEFNDVTGKMDVGRNVLKIPSKTVLDLDEFVPSINFCGLENWRKDYFKELKGSDLKNCNLKVMLAGNNKCVITPSKMPPTKKEVDEWLRNKIKEPKTDTRVIKVEKTRIHIPMSPGNESMDETLSMSPCSPLENFDNNASSPEITTPTSSDSPALNRRGIKRKRGDLKRKALFAQTLLSQMDGNADKSALRRQSSDSFINILSQKFSNESHADINIIGSQNVSADVTTNEKFNTSSDISVHTDSEEMQNNKNNSLINHPRFLGPSKLKPSDLNISNESGSKPNDSCQITGVTLDNTYGFKMSYENLQNAKALCLTPNLTVLVIEIHTRVRGDSNPDPDFDSVRAIFYSVLTDIKDSSKNNITGILAVDTLPGSPNPKGLPLPPILDGTGIDCEITYSKSEIELMDEFIKLIKKYDPDIFAGYEIEMLSWGYLIQRSYVLGINLPILISRLNPDVVKPKNMEQEDFRDMKIPGRIVLDIWRLLRHEVALQSYTFENIMYHVLHERTALHSFKDLAFWWDHRTNLYRHITANYYIKRVEGVLRILDQLDLIGRTCELAKLFGIQFYEVLSRGSQFRVESLMLRLSKPQNYIPVSPSVQQRAHMRAPEWLPLILEPESRLYTDPVIVLDFQSLYPSIIIAYNYCFSTCIGRVEKICFSYPFEFGATQLKIPPSRLEKLQNKINFSPCGVGFVRPEVRKGILPRMLQEILETRLMVKNSMKENKDNKILQRVLHSRQLGLKLIANVTYGYTAANFSGRMPCIEVGDSVVSKGRETLERAIKLIESTEDWGARVVYGDTDSLFVLVPGKDRKEAFRIGAEIADAVTNDNPSPVKLKLEKVYQPCILQTKKRYVGYMYESPEQTQPEYNAKGIETVRRDGCPAVAKILEKSLRILFETCDVSLIKKYVNRQFSKIITGRASIQDLTFAREYRGAGGYRPGACVPALELAKKWRTVDKRKEPRRGERVPYVVVNGPPGLPLIRLVRSPYELLADPSLRPNALYYITKVIIPPVNRCFTLFGADLSMWFNEMPRKQIQALPTEFELMNNNKKSTISQYFSTMSCAVCGNQTHKGLCDVCLTKPQSTVVALNYKMLMWERHQAEINQICQSCCSRPTYTDCISLDCPVLYRLNQTKRDLNQAFFVRNLITNF